MGNVDLSVGPETGGGRDRSGTTRGSGGGETSEAGRVEAGVKEGGSETTATEAVFHSTEELARLIDVALLAADLSEEDVAAACELSRTHKFGSVTLRPADVQLAADWLKGSGVTPVAAVSYPHGASTTAVKNYEVRDLLSKGARGIATPMNLGKLKSRRFQYIEMELIQMVTEARRAGAKVTLELDLAPLPLDLRVIALKIVRRTEVDQVRVSNGGGPVSPTELEFLKSKLGDYTAIWAGWNITTLDEAESYFRDGITGLRSSDPAAILAALKSELEPKSQADPASSTPSEG